MPSTNQVQWGTINVTLDRLSLLDRMFLVAALVGILLISFPHLASAEALNASPQVFETNPVAFENYLNQTQITSNEISEAIRDGNLPLAINWQEDPKIQILEQYLAGKHSPIAPYAKDLLKQNNYKYILGISFAESNFCKYNIRSHNCWGIGGGNPESYESYPHAFARANDLIQKYHDSGLTSPELMRNRWVGWENRSWVVAVNQVIAELDALGL